MQSYAYLKSTNIMQVSALYSFYHSKGLLMQSNRRVISDVQDLKTAFFFCHNMMGFGETYSAL